MGKGAVAICTERCKGCELCLRACPQGVLRLSDHYNTRGYRTVMLDERLGMCTGCGICAVVCPEAGFTVFREPRPQPARQAA